jgi:hypothetical protein
LLRSSLFDHVADRRPAARKSFRQAVSDFDTDRCHRRMAVQARERLLAAAEELFYAEGIRAVSVAKKRAHWWVGSGLGQPP